MSFKTFFSFGFPHEGRLEPQEKQKPTSDREKQDTLPTEFQTLLKTSTTHPLNISWILPPFLLDNSKEVHPAAPSWFVRKFVNQNAVSVTNQLKRKKLSDDALNNLPARVSNNQSQFPTRVKGAKTEDDIATPPKALSKSRSERLTKAENESMLSAMQMDRLQIELKHELQHVSFEENGLQHELIEIATVEEIRVLKRYIDCDAKKSFGNLALSSVPGKKVRMNGKGISKSRVPFCRNLEIDFQRIAEMNITLTVNLLDDTELALLGAAWPEYERAARKVGVDIIRFPIVEGEAPTDLLKFHNQVIRPISELVMRKENVLCHCRGGLFFKTLIMV